MSGSSGYFLGAGGAEVGRVAEGMDPGGGGGAKTIGGVEAEVMGGTVQDIPGLEQAFDTQ